MANPNTPKKENNAKGLEPGAAKVDRTPLVLVTKPGKKVEISYYLLEGSEDTKENRLARIVATKAANRVLKYANAEEILKDELQPGFVRLAWEGESYLSAHSEVEFTHGICPGCAKTVIEEFKESNLPASSGVTGGK